MGTNDKISEVIKNQFTKLSDELQQAIVKSIREEMGNDKISNDDVINVYKKGEVFENYVKNKFSRKYFSLEYQTPSFEANRDWFINSSKRPDFTLTYKHKLKKIKFSVECKYRASLYKGKYNWAKKKQMDRYKQFMKKEGHPVFVVMGLGGKPDNPDKMYCVPLDEIKYVGLYPKILEPYEKNPGKNFFLDTESVVLK